jgi:hypothetical protein
MNITINKPISQCVVQGIGIDGTVTSSTQNSSPVIILINLKPGNRSKPPGMAPGGGKITVA